jgi:hypothetical protein
LGNVAAQVQEHLARPVAVKRPQFPDRVKVNIQWPTSLSCFAPWEVQEIQWYTMVSEACTLRRYVVELYYEELFLQKIGEVTFHETAKIRSGSYSYRWFVPNNLFDCRLYRVKVTAWDESSPVGSSITPFFKISSSSNNWQTMMPGALMGLGAATMVVAGIWQNVGADDFVFALVSSVLVIGVATWTGAVALCTTSCVGANIAMPMAMVIGGAAGWFLAPHIGIDMNVSGAILGAIGALWLVVYQYEELCRKKLDSALFSKNLERIYRKFRNKLADSQKPDLSATPDQSRDGQSLDSLNLHGRNDEVFFDQFGRPCRRVKRVMDGRRIIEERYFDPNGEIELYHETERYHCVKRAYDESGRLIQEEYFDTDNMPTEDKNGFVQIKYDYDSKVNARNVIVAKKGITYGGREVVMAAKE